MRLPLVVGWLAFVYLLAFASPAHFWLDSGEIGAAGAELGVIHPPGAVGYTLLLRAATVLPLGSLGFRMALLSSALGAATVGGLVGMLRSRGVHVWIALGAAAWLLAGWTFVRQGRVVEIYALQGALMVVVLWGFDPAAPAESRTGRRVLGVMAAVWAAWCFGDARLALVLPVVVGWAVALGRRRAWARWAPLAVVMMSAVVMVLPLASVRAPLTDWGDPDTLAAAWDHLMAGSIRRAYADAMWPTSGAMWQLNGAAVLDALAEDLGPLGPAIGLCSLVALGWRPAVGRGERGVALGLAWLVAVELLYAVAINPMGVAERQTGLVTALLLCVGVAELARRHLQPRTRAMWAVVPLLFVVLALPAGLRSAPDAVNTRSWGPHSWTRAALAQLPPGSLLLTQSDDLAAGSINARVIEGARPDVVSIPAQHLYKPVPEAYLLGTPAHRVWAAAQPAPDEPSRIEAAITAHAPPIGVESPTVSLMQPVRWWSERGAPPLRVGTRDEPLAATLPVPPTDAETIAHWSGRLSGDEDQRRLAWALANDARAHVRVYRNYKAALRTLEAVTQQVSEREAGVWVALGALQDRFGDTAAAVASTRRALALEPGRTKALTNLALYLARDRSTLDEAAQMANRAIALQPREPDGWLRLATIRELQGDLDAAGQARLRMQELLN